MLPIEALHNSARRYLIDRVSYWHEQYAQLGKAGRDRRDACDDNWTYTEEAYDTFPRYNVLGAILHAVEVHVPADFATVDDARAGLVEAGQSAKSPFTRGTNATEISAMNDERDRFASFIMSVDISQRLADELLPFRRVLGEDEHQKLRESFENKWGKWYGGYPDRDELPPHVTLHTAAMGDCPGYEGIQDYLHSRRVTRVLELREFGGGYEIDVRWASFQYDGDEGFWTSSDLSWMVYASHESSITFGGSELMAHMRLHLPDFERYLYKGWDLDGYR